MTLFRVSCSLDRLSAHGGLGCCRAQTRGQRAASHPVRGARDCGRNSVAPGSPRLVARPQAGI